MFFKFENKSENKKHWTFHILSLENMIIRMTNSKMYLKYTGSNILGESITIKILQNVQSSDKPLERWHKLWNYFVQSTFLPVYIPDLIIIFPTLFVYLNLDRNEMSIRGHHINTPETLRIWEQYIKHLLWQCRWLNGGKVYRKMDITVYTIVVYLHTVSYCSFEIYTKYVVQANQY